MKNERNIFLIENQCTVKCVIISDDNVDTDKSPYYWSNCPSAFLHGNMTIGNNLWMDVYSLYSTSSLLLTGVWMEFLCNQFYEKVKALQQLCLHFTGKSQSEMMVMLKHCVSYPCPVSHPNRKLLLALIDFDWYHPNDGLAWLAVIRNKINFIHYLQFIPISYKIGNSVWGLIWCLRYKEDSKAEEFLGHKIPKVC